MVTADLDYPRLLVLEGAIGPSLILFRGGEWGGVDVIAQMQQIFDGMASVRRTEQPIACRAAVK
jgi:hypothetical protein